MSSPLRQPDGTSPLLIARWSGDMVPKKCDAKDLLRRRLPIITWLPFYTWSKLLQDCLAGLTVGLTAIPQGIAYAVVAGLPAQYGLYSGFMALFVYVILGGSKDITIGPTAIVALMTQEHIAKLGEDGAVLLCFLMGSFILILGLLQLGFLLDFISMPVTLGFTNAAAITIAATQFKSLFGLSGSSNGFIDSLEIVFNNLSSISLWDTLLGLGCILILLGLKYLKGSRTGNSWQKTKWVCSLARNAIVVILATLLAYLLYINDLEPFKLTGKITEGLPPFGLPPFTITHNNQTYNFVESIQVLGISVISLPLIAVLENIAIAKAFAKGRSLDATQEMIALGAGNILGSFVRSMPTTGSFTRTAINNASGVQTQLAGIFTATLVLLACGLLTVTFEFIPKASLAAVIIVAMYYMLELDVFRILWRTNKIDLIPFVVTLVCCVFLGLEYGMIVGILVNMVLLLYSSARPGIMVELEVANGVQFLLITPRQSLSYPAAEYLRKEVIARCEAAGENLPVVLDGRHVHRIDATVAKNLKYLQGDLESRKQMFILWNWSPEVRKTLEGYDDSLAKHFRITSTLDGAFTDNNLNSESSAADLMYDPTSNRFTALGSYMGSRRGGSGGGRGAGVLKERANMSFMLVVMFFAVFGLIVLTEIFLIDDRHGSNVSGTGALGGHRNGHRLVAAPDRPDYEEVGAEDYAGLRGSFDEHVGLLVKDTVEGGKPVASLADPRGLPSLPPSLEARLPHLNQSLRLTHADWLPVTNTRYKFFVYSAYYDNRGGGGDGPGLIRVIGATKTRSPERVWCRLWYNLHATGNATASITVAAKVKVIRENWNLKYSACFVICPLPKTPPETPDGRVPNKVPNSISVVARLKAQPANRILIQNRPSDRPKEREALAVCVKPLHFDYNRVIQLIEFIELHRLLGASHVTLYNDTLGNEAGCVLKDYESRSSSGSDHPLVTLLPWHHLDMISQREIRTEGLFAALNDCLYRSMYSYELVALLDLDEFIIPRHNYTIPELISWLGKRISTKSTGAYSFQNAFFYLQWADDPSVKNSQTPEEAALITLRKSRRKVKLHPHKQRSKYICKPENVVEAGNHFVWEFIPGHGALNIPADAAILHHYRVCEFGGDDCVKSPSVVDRTASRYGPELARNVRIRYRELAEKCSLPELDPVPAAASGEAASTPLVQKTAR